VIIEQVEGQRKVYSSKIADQDKKETDPAEEGLFSYLQIEETARNIIKVIELSKVAQIDLAQREEIAKILASKRINILSFARIELEDMIMTTTFFFADSGQKKDKNLI
jgi:hypothetical protein